MRPIRLLALALAPLLLAACETQPVAAAAPAIPLTGRVVDKADLLSDERERALSDRLARLERDKRAQFVVVTVRSLDGRTVNEYTLDLARAWGIGSRERNDGVVLLVAPNERKVRIEVGYGLENVLKDEICAEIIRKTIIPALEKDDMTGGIERGADAIMQRLRALPVARPMADLGFEAMQPRMVA